MPTTSAWHLLADDASAVAKSPAADAVAQLFAAVAGKLGDPASAPSCSGSTICRGARG